MGKRNGNYNSPSYRRKFFGSCCNKSYNLFSCTTQAFLQFCATLSVTVVRQYVVQREKSRRRPNLIFRIFKAPNFLNYSLDQWWRTYGTRARGGTHSPLCGHAHRRSSAEFVTRQVEVRGAWLLPRLRQPSEKTLLPAVVCNIKSFSSAASCI